MGGRAAFSDWHPGFFQVDQDISSWALSSYETGVFCFDYTIGNLYSLIGAGIL